MGIVFEVDRELPCGCCNTCVGGSEHRRLFHRILPSKDGRCAHVRPHHLRNRQVTNPANIGGTADGFAAQVEPPGGE